MSSRILLGLVLWSGLAGQGLSSPSVSPSIPSETANGAHRFFLIRVVDEQTGRGVPLIELKTTNGISLLTDSQGVIAFEEPGLMDREVFFFVRGPGYEYPADGFGNRGVRLQVRAGQTAEIRLKRVNIAERLYRITGQGIYRDSTLAGLAVPISPANLNGQVMGQDSVQTCLYHDKLYWFWGDTNGPFYPLGNFSTSGAFSLLPQKGGLDPAVGVDLHYFTDERGFCKKMVPLNEEGVVWIEGVCAAADAEGAEHMTAFFTRRKGLTDVVEYGLLEYEDAACCFRPVIRSRRPLVPLDGIGHPFEAVCRGRRYFYFAVPFPLGVRLRIPARWEAMLAPETYEIYTALSDSGANRKHEPGCRWVSLETLSASWDAEALRKALREERRKSVLLYDRKTGSSVVPHNGSAAWNSYRRKWILIAVQEGGDSSYLGEVWYAEADTPAGPWGYAQKVVSHDRYSFYNPKHHPYFDQKEGRWIYFEGTYSYTFSGSQERAAPRYDYNQILYRLDLQDVRLRLPEPVYEVQPDGGGLEYLFGSQVRAETKQERITRIAFWAVSPERTFEGLVPVSAVRTEEGVRLSRGTADGKGILLFYAYPPEGEHTDSVLVPLFEYRHKKEGWLCYSPDSPAGDEWERSSAPICWVWKNPARDWAADWEAEPSVP